MTDAELRRIEAWRKAHAKFITDKVWGINSSDAGAEAFENGVRAGMAAEHEVARLMERIDMMSMFFLYNATPSQESLKQAKAQLAALLAGGKVE